jgi:hypothetical protein
VKAAAIGRSLGIGLAGAVAVVIVTWLLEQAIPPPYSGYLALVVVGLVAIQILKSRPLQRAERLFRLYLRARARGASEAEARARLLARLHRRGEARGRADADLGPSWTGRSERERAIGGVGALLARQGVRIDTSTLALAWNRSRDRFTIPGWEAQPPEFVDAIRGRLEEREQRQLDALVEEYRLFQQRFFRAPSALAADPGAGVEDFARLLGSLGNRVATDRPGDAERAYRLSLRLRPERSLAHAGLALLLARTGRTREAAREARAALDVLDDFARRAGAEAPATEDIFPFRSPLKLREALERVAGGGPHAGA